MGTVLASKALRMSLLLDFNRVEKESIRCSLRGVSMSGRGNMCIRRVGREEARASFRSRGPFLRVSWRNYWNTGT